MFQKSIWLFCIIFFITEKGFSQNQILVEKLNSIAFETEVFLGYDNQRNNYSIKENVLSKNSTKSHFEYKNVTLGKITHVDFQNPLQIVVFYNDFNIVILLDNQLNEIKKIDFNNFSVAINLDAIALSSQNKLWFFDAISSKIGLYNLTNDSFSWISTPLENPVAYYSSNYTNFYWIDTKNNIFSISIYGTIEALAFLPKFETIQLVNSEIILYAIENQLYYYEIKTRRIHKINIAEKFVTNFFFADRILAIFTQNEITNYKLILP